MIKELNEHFEHHKKMYCVFNVLDNARGRDIESYMLSWLTTKYDVISVVHDGKEYEYDGLRYAIDLSISSREPVLYVHTKGAVNYCEFADKVISLWRDEFIEHYAEYEKYIRGGAIELLVRSVVSII